MAKYILIAFGFLGFSFYELSGGSDFDGKALRISRVEASPIKEGLPKIAAANSLKPETLKAGTQNDLAASSISFDMVSSKKLEGTAAAQSQNAQTDVKQASFTATPNEETASESAIANILPSLIAQPKTVSTSQEPLITTTGDLRLVSGKLVNVRGGPGEQYDVVGKLTRGNEVEVLAESGDGWVEMRSTDGVTIGWVAGFLLNKG